MPKKTVSLSNELTLMMDAVGGVHRLTRHWIENYGLDVDEVPEAISAMLAILVERLRLLDRVARGTLDPRLAWCPENDTIRSPGDPGEEDVRLESWSDDKLARHHHAEWKNHAEWKRAKRRVPSGKRRSAPES